MVASDEFWARRERGLCLYTEEGLKGVRMKGFTYLLGYLSGDKWKWIQETK